MKQTAMTADRGRNATGPYGVVYRSAIERIPDRTAIALYALLVTFAHDGVAWPHQTSLAAMLGCDRKTVQRALDALIACGVVACQPRLDKGRKIGNEYVILAPGSDTHVATADATPVSRTDATPVSLPNHLEQSLEHTAPRRRSTRPRDPLFDAVCEACSYDVNNLTRTEAGRVARACAELRQLSPVPEADDVLAFGRTWCRQSPRYACTPQAITGNWTRIMRQDEMAARAERRRRNDFGVA